MSTPEEREEPVTPPLPEDEQRLVRLVDLAESDQDVLDAFLFCSVVPQWVDFLEEGGSL